MKSVRLNREDRESIINRVVDMSVKEWDESPAGQRRFELEDEMSIIIADAQLEDIPAVNRVILEKYNACSNVLRERRIERDSKGVMEPPFIHWKDRDILKWFEKPGHTFKIVLLNLSNDNSMNPIYSASDATEYILKHHAELLNEWYDIMEVRKCEIKKICDAWKSVVYSYTTSKKLLDAFPEARKYIPDWILNYDPAPKTPVEETDRIKDAKAVIKSFGGGSDDA